VINRDQAGDKSTEEYCEAQGIPVLLRIPLDTAIARLYSVGVPLVEGMPQWQPAFHSLFEDIQQTMMTQSTGEKSE
jgi:MinD superfamily P-loop ATPase